MFWLIYVTVNIGKISCGSNTGMETFAPLFNAMVNQRRILGRARGRSPPPLDWGQKNFIARPKNTHICKPPFCMPECAKTHLQQSRISKFPSPRRGGSGEDPEPPLRGEGRDEGRRGRGKGRREGMDGKGQGREGGREGRNGGGEGRSTWAPPPPL